MADRFHSIPVVLAVFFFIYLHRRSVARQRREDAIDIGKNDDFGMSPALGRKRSGIAEKSVGHKNHPISMDMNTSTPYLLPPGINESHESLSSLARSLTAAEDPYRPVTRNGDTGSMRSWNPGNRNRESVHTMNSVCTGKSQGGGISRHTSLAKPATVRLDTIGDDAQPQPTTYAPRDMHALESMRSGQIEDASYSGPIHSVEPLRPEMPQIQEPEPAMSRRSRNDLPDRPKWDNSPLCPRPVSIEVAASVTSNPPSSLVSAFAPKLELNLDLNLDAGPRSPEFDASFDAVPSSTPPRDVTLQFAAFTAPKLDNSADIHETHPQFTIQTVGDDKDDDYNQSQPVRRHSLELHFEETQSHQILAGLYVPPDENRRLSVVGQRPLPPNDIGDSDDPEYRANRIRSFYKEYFGETDEPSSLPPVPALPESSPAMPSQHPASQHPASYMAQGPPYGSGPPPPRRGPPLQAGYRYQENSNGKFGSNAAPYYDPDHNTFIMPYAQPVTRRAMTPPPRFRNTGPQRGDNGPIRLNHGSIGNMSGVSGISAGPRPGSSVSNRFNNSQAGSRAGSSMSYARSRPPPRPRGPPPSDLSTLPTPSKLTDDGLSLLGAIDFAPPMTYADRARGRSQSPAGGERRPYKFNMPVHTPLVSSYDELTAIPSP